MLYVNKNVHHKIKKQLKEFDNDNLIEIRDFVNQQGLSFLSIKKCDNGELQFINDHDYILLGPCGGVYKTAGKYSAFSADNDQGVIDTLTLDLENVITGASEFDVLNVGWFFNKRK